jgi:hypothetical protein
MYCGWVARTKNALLSARCFEGYPFLCHPCVVVEFLTTKTNSPAQSDQTYSFATPPPVA